MGIGRIERTSHWLNGLRIRLYTGLLASQFREFGSGSRIAPPFRFYGLNQISIGKKVMINRDCWLQTLSDTNETTAVKLRLGSHAGIGMGTCISAAREVVLEEYVLLARNVYISDHAHAFEKIDLPIMQQGINRIAPVIIGRETWLGQNVVVLPGATIGRHCVIGANSVVITSIPDFSVAVGAPARVVKQYDPEKRQWQSVGEPVRR